MTDQSTPNEPQRMPQQTTDVVIYDDPFANPQAFEFAQRVSRLFASATFLPAHFQNNIGNCLILRDTARRMKMPVLQVANGLNVIQGRPSWGATFVAAAINASGLFSPLRFEYRGTENTDDWACRAHATDLGTREQVHGPWVSIRMAKAEGWYQRSGSKWQTMPQVMLTYRAISFFGKIYAGHILSGMQTTDEVEDIVFTPPANGAATPAAQPAIEQEVVATADAAGLNERVRRRRQRQPTEAAPPPIEGTAAPVAEAEPAEAAAPNPEEFF